MKLLVVPAILCVAQRQAGDHKGQYPLPSPRQDPDSGNNDVNLIPHQTEDDGKGWTDLYRWTADCIEWLESTKANESRSSKRTLRKIQIAKLLTKSRMPPMGFIDQFRDH